MTAGRRRSMEEFLQQQRGMEPDDRDTGSLATAARPAVIGLRSLPDPYTATAEGRLSDREQADLATCEAALDNLRVAFWAAGKVLQVIRDGRLYRDTYATFEDYVEQRWDMSRPQAYRLIDAWPLAERLFPMGGQTQRTAGPRAAPTRQPPLPKTELYSTARPTRLAGFLLVIASRASVPPPDTPPTLPVRR